jgi:hypothetical protein
VGNPTKEQLLCVAEGIGVPTDDHERLVRRGFNATFAEATLEILYRAVILVPNGSVAMMNMKVELSEVDGQVLFSGFAHQPMNDDVPDWKDVSVTLGSGGRAKGSRLAGLCGISDSTAVNSASVLCVARALGMAEGKDGLRVRRNENGWLGGPSWVVQNTLDDRPCQFLASRLEIAERGGSVIGYGYMQAHSAHESCPERPIVRALREDGVKASP